VRQALGVPEDGLLMMAVGRLTAVKNYPLLLRASAEVFRAFPGAVLTVVGEGEAQASLASLARDLRIADRVRFTGFRKDVSDLLHASDLFVHASLMEGCPNVVLEAMAMGKPVVATEVGGVPELVRHGETGLLVPTGNEAALARALEGMLEAPGMRRRMGEAGRSRARQVFDRQTQVVRLESYLDRMTGWKGEMVRSSFPLPAGTWPQPRPPEMFFARRCRRRYRRPSQRAHS
jgi:glycosyltransferase involved in cell wall biosynthesis